jgi:DNA invertase Pin-like site-specific DNA recombinase
MTSAAGTSALLGQIDLSVGSGELMPTMAGLVEFERDLIWDRIKSGLAAARGCGVLIGPTGGTASDRKAKKVLAQHKEALIPSD